MTDEQRDALAAQYLEQLPYEPYPVQEEALLSWFTAEQGVLVCARTGTGKTLIAEAALFEALHLDRIAYYTTPLIALTEQKFHEMQQAAVRWGFSADDVGLVTGTRSVNPNARVLVVVAEVLFNRLLRPEAFAFDEVHAVVMDEFHSFNDPERGIVWEFTLGMLPAHIRTLLLSATVGNALEFVNWLRINHQRKLELVQSTDRKVPLTFQWIGDQLLNELIEEMASGDDVNRRVPALVFCFNRDECWNIAEQLKGKKLISSEQQKELAQELESHDFSPGAGPKLRQLLLRGVGVHHAGVLPRYKRIVEDLFQRKLLSIAVCTETLSAGINLPARSVVVPMLLKGPPGKKKVLEPSGAHQIFGRAGRPQFDDQGYVYVLAHEDDVKIQRWRVKYDEIPEDTKDPQLRKAKKALKKKMPTRRSTQQYWTEEQFRKLTEAPPGKLGSRGPLPWRLLAYMLDASPDVEPIRQLVSKRLLTGKDVDTAHRALDQMLMTLWSAGYVTLEPPPLAEPEPSETPAAPSIESAGKLALGVPEPPPPYRATTAEPTEELEKLLHFRSVHPLYGVFLLHHLGVADDAERIQAWESVLEMPPSVAHHVRVPPPDRLPPGPLAMTRVDERLLALGLATAEELGAESANESDEEEPDSRHRGMFEEERVYVLSLAEKLRRLFEHDFPSVHGLRTQSVWAAGDILELGGDFNKYVTSNRLQKQEGILFRHLLRLVMLIHEFAQLHPADTDPALWREELVQLAERIAACCRNVDPTSTDKALEEIPSEENTV